MLVPFGILVAAIAAIYVVLIRPWAMNWGSTRAERGASLPGDDLVPDARYVTTRAVTIAAAPAEVWPWLVQMGQDRAGFYTHNWVERALRSGIHDVHVIHPEWQELVPGSLMRTNHDIGGKAIGWPVEAVDREHSIVLRSKGMPLGSYAFILRPIDEGHTRLIVRDRAAWKRSELPFTALVYEPLHAYMETGLIRGVRQRVEATATKIGVTDSREVQGSVISDGS